MFQLDGWCWTHLYPAIDCGTDGSWPDVRRMWARQGGHTHHPWLSVQHGWIISYGVSNFDLFVCELTVSQR